MPANLEKNDRTASKDRKAPGKRIRYIILAALAILHFIIALALFRDLPDTIPSAKLPLFLTSFLLGYLVGLAAGAAIVFMWVIARKR